LQLRRPKPDDERRGTQKMHYKGRFWPEVPIPVIYRSILDRPRPKAGKEMSFWDKL
jgi:hypothetical protein